MAHINGFDVGGLAGPAGGRGGDRQVRSDALRRRRNTRYDDQLNGGVHNVFIAEGHVYARYEVPEAGTHNLWAENDVLYIAYYNGGLRVVDASRGHIFVADHTSGL